MALAAGMIRRCHPSLDLTNISGIVCLQSCIDKDLDEVIQMGSTTSVTDQ
jgi:hypothetical protein